MLHPDDGNVFGASLVDQVANVRDYQVAFECTVNDSILDVDDDKSSVWTIRQRSHAANLRADVDLPVIRPEFRDADAVFHTDTCALIEWRNADRSAVC